jgi:hypothetical protein
MSDLCAHGRGDATQASKITAARMAPRLHDGATMRGSLVLVLVLLGGCSDEGEGEDCGASSLQLEVTPVQACLQLTATETAGAYQITGTNNCAEPLVVHYNGTHDGGANETFAAGAQISISLNDSEVFNQDTAIKTWTRNAVLGSEILVITMTKAPC